jgi:hypothetical protein
MRTIRSLALLAAATGSCSLLACVIVDDSSYHRGPSHPPVVERDEGHGPPPWAPAHGYRRKHERAYQSRPDTVDLVFDSGLGVYVVVGIPNYYYWDGVYLRIDSGRWYRAPYLDARWAPCPVDSLPGNLRSKPVKRYNGPPTDRSYDSKSRGKSEDRGHAKGKGKGRGHDHDDEQ